MEQEVNVSLLSILSFSVNNAIEKPILFKYGDNFDVDITFKVFPSAGGMYTVAKIISNYVKESNKSFDSNKSFKAISKLQYSYTVDNQKKIRTIGAYSTEFKQEDEKLYYELNNKFTVNSSELLPSAIEQRYSGSFTFSVDWVMDGLLRGNIITAELPILEQVGTED